MKYIIAAFLLIGASAIALEVEINPVAGTNETALTPASVTATGDVKTTGGAFVPYARTKAQFSAMTPSAAGLVYWCSDCTEKLLCVSTGTALSDFQRVDSPTAGCGTGE